MIWEGIDQRKFPRASYKCRIRVSRDGKEEEVYTYTENIGAGGVCVVLEKALELFETVSLDIYLKDKDEPISCKGTVVWVVKRHPSPADEKDFFKYDLGIEFQDISEENRGKITQIVKEILNSNA